VFVYVNNPDAAALLVLTDQFYPGWTAEVDGKPRPVIRVNYCFRGVVIPRGSRMVVFSFEPQSFRRGQLMACVGWLVLIGTAVAPSLIRRRGGAA
jgi:uncharacterized membrane protein YfhO